MTFYDAAIFTGSMLLLIAACAVGIIVLFGACFFAIGGLAITLRLPIRVFDHTATKDDLIVEGVISAMFLASATLAIMFFA